MRRKRKRAHLVRKTELHLAHNAHRIETLGKFNAEESRKAENVTRASANGLCTAGFLPSLASSRDESVLGRRGFPLDIVRVEVHQYFRNMIPGTVQSVGAQ